VTAGFEVEAAVAIGKRAKGAAGSVVRSVHGLIAQSAAGVEKLPDVEGSRASRSSEVRSRGCWMSSRQTEVPSSAHTTSTARPGRSPEAWFVNMAPCYTAPQSSVE
jgi:hypothetical protein